MKRLRWCALGLAIGSSAASVASAQTGATAILDRVQMNPRRPIDFHAIVLPDTVYVGQQATYQVAVMLSPDARSRLRRNPEFLPPELQGLLAYELGTPTRVPARNYAGGVFEAHVFQRALFPVASGAQMVPAPQLTYALPQSSSYFSREERFVVRAESAAFIVKALPIEGRPDDFNGAVGVFKSSVRIDTTTARVGDPLLLTLRVQGTGNVKLLPRPTIELDWASAVPGTERIFVDSSGSLVRGTKEFDWILTPAREGPVGVPSLRYAYFNPYVGAYATAESAPIALTVKSGTLAVSDEGESASLSPLRSTGESSRRVVTWSGAGWPPTPWLFWAVMAMLIPLPALVLSRVARKPLTRKGALGVAGSTTATTRIVESGMRGAARATRTSLFASLSGRFGQNPQALVSRRHVTRVLRRAGVTRETTRDLLALLERLDELGFADADADTHVVARDTALRDESALAQRAAELLKRVDMEALPRGRQMTFSTTLAFWLLVGMASATIGTGPVSGQGTGSATSLQSMARDAYEKRAFTEAAQRFRALAAAQPNNPDQLFNWGTAAWAAGDTVEAVMAWQRAARLEPLATDLQERISVLPSGARGGVADVPMVPVAWLLRGGFALWIAGWSLLAWRAWRRRQSAQPGETRGWRWARGAAQSALLLAVVAVAAAWWGMRALDASALAVVRRPDTMRIAPGTDADAMGGVTTGDVVRVVETRDAWQRVVHADGRRGWLPSPRLVALVIAPDAPSAPMSESTPRDLPAR